MIEATSETSMAITERVSTSVPYGSSRCDATASAWRTTLKAHQSITEKPKEQEKGEGVILQLAEQRPLEGEHQNRGEEPRDGRRERDQPMPAVFDGYGRDPLVLVHEILMLGV